MNSIPDFTSFTHQQAFNMGTRALQLVKERAWRRIGVRITLDDKLVFQYLMDGKNEDKYLKGKEKVVLTTHQSSDFVDHHKEDYASLLLDPSFCVSGGSVPILIEGKCHGAISISGMTSQADHDLALEVLCIEYDNAKGQQP